MIDLEEFVVSGFFGTVGRASTRADVLESFGEPELVEPGRRSRPMILKYGDIEFRMTADRLIAVAVRFEAGRPVDGRQIPVTGFRPGERRTLEAVGELLGARDVLWRVDPVMSRINPEESSQAWITSAHVHLGFFRGTLQRATANYESGERHGIAMGARDL